MPAKNAHAAKNPTLQEAKGTIVAVDTALILDVIAYMTERGLRDEFRAHLSEQGHTQVLLDVATANHLKRSVRKKRMTDSTAQMIIECACNSGSKGP
ncbi:MAG TPA: hypothetical protein VMU69_30890 [Bradyrhizobium sp.]|nr:hypothetical protein [Bradyrhizobium sp.]